ncbi:MAG: response regulator transcription factor [gamma proteobacterium endosymbiont of Lamellibrachia anaximandri]|nr:response regulator transcription factor [gamma proteobacterium endosymbiont of Lamellibrachia anaximandri]
MEKQLRVVIAEDHTILRAGLKSLLEGTTDYSVVGEAENGREAIRCVADKKPDLAIMDLNMPSMNGMDAVQEIRKRFPETKILVLTVHNAEEYVLASLNAGANGYILKDATHSELLVAVERVMNGKTYLSPDITDKVVQGYLVGQKNSEPATEWDTITKREKQILKLVAEGHTNKSMAEFLCISIKTVEKHRANLMKKLDLHNASALTTYALNKGIVSH